tara:strand:+ start:31446 stop:31670 length:225 start_codon:yes stop_codon:yes gene_type:complete
MKWLKKKKKEKKEQLYRRCGLVRVMTGETSFRWVAVEKAKKHALICSKGGAYWKVRGVGKEELTEKQILDRYKK